MKNLEAIRKMDNFEKRLDQLNKDYTLFKKEVKGETMSNKKKSKSKKK